MFHCVFQGQHFAHKLGRQWAGGQLTNHMDHTSGKVRHLYTVVIAFHIPVSGIHRVDAKEKLPEIATT